MKVSKNIATVLSVAALMMNNPAKACEGKDYDYGGGQGCDGSSTGCGNSWGYLLDGFEYCSSGTDLLVCTSSDRTVGKTWDCTWDVIPGTCNKGPDSDIIASVVSLYVPGCC